MLTELNNAKSVSLLIKTLYCGCKGIDSTGLHNLTTQPNDFISAPNYNLNNMLKI